MYLFGEPYFETFIVKNAFQAAFVFLIISEIFIWVITNWNSRKKSGSRKKSDKGSCFLIVLGYYSIIFLNPVCRRIFSNSVPVCVFWIGVVFMVLGVLLRGYSIYTLGKFFTLNVQVNSEQKIIQTGPYKILRHPAYSGSILSLIGTALCFRSLIGIMTTVVIIASIYGYRIVIEEKTLENSFGTIYKEYEKNTNRIIPFIW